MRLRPAGSFNRTAGRVWACQIPSSLGITNKVDGKDVEMSFAERKKANIPNHMTVIMGDSQGEQSHTLARARA